MIDFTSLTKKISDYLNYWIFKIKKFRLIYKLRNEFSLELLLNKYLNNKKNVIDPFINALPLKKYKSNPILKEGQPGTWDEAGIYEPFLLFNGNKYFLYYESYSYNKQYKWQIGVASADRIIGPWIKYPNNPILSFSEQESDFDKNYIADPCVVFNNDKYHMWFDMHDGKTTRIGKAYSNDGFNWEKYKIDNRTAVMIDLGNKFQWDDKLVHCPEVYLWNNKFHLLYGAKGVGHFDFDTGLAIQIDKNGENFCKWGQITTDEMLGKMKIISRLQPGIIINGIIIAGLRVRNRLSKETTYMVFSDDGGKSWYKLSDPILNPGNENQWDSNIYYGPNCWIISEGKLWAAYLGGKKRNLRRAGLAYMKIPNLK